MKNLWTKYLYIVGIALLLPQLTLGASLECPLPETNATVGNAGKIEAKITKFSFNNDEDFAEIAIGNDGNSVNATQGVTLSGWKLSTIDTTVFTFDSTPHHTGENIHIITKPLAATTDQLLLMDEKGETRDAICWINDKPTISEQQDLQKLLTQGEWKETCLNSTGLAKNTIFQRKTTIDTNTMNDWGNAGALSTLQQSQPQTQPPTSIAAQTTTQTTVTATSPMSALIAQNEVIINEFIPDPDGSDDGQEWIELKNTSDHAVSLNGWKLDDIEGGSSPYTFVTETIASESFLILSNGITKITLNNTNDSVRLINPEGAVTDQTSYTKTVTGKSFARDSKNNWYISTNPTPNEENEAAQTGNTAQGTATDVPDTSRNVSNTPDASSISDASQISSGTDTANAAMETPMEISEIFPNPSGTDTGKEWIEIHNKSTEPINIGGWKIQTKNGKTYILPENAMIPAEGYMSFTDKTSKLQLKNTNEELWLIDPEGSLSDHVTYESAPENESFARIAAIQETSGGHDGKALQMGVQAAQASSETGEIIVWNWTQLITQGGPNPQLASVTGTVVGPPLEDSFQLSINQKITNVFFDNKDQNIYALLKSALIKGASVNAQVLRTTDGKLHLVSFKTAATEKTTASFPIWFVVVTLLIIFGAAATRIIRTYGKKIHSTIHDDPNPSTSADTPSHIFLSAPRTELKQADQE